jgi:hypothetical protein
MRRKSSRWSGATSQPNRHGKIPERKTNAEARLRQAGAENAQTH